MIQEDSISSLFPSPHQPILRINHFSYSLEPAFRKHTRGCIWFRECVCPNETDAILSKRVIRQRSCGFRRVPFTSVFRVYTVGDFNHSFGIRWPFETALAYSRPALLMDQLESVNPRVSSC